MSTTSAPPSESSSPALPPDTAARTPLPADTVHVHVDDSPPQPTSTPQRLSASEVRGEHGRLLAAQEERLRAYIAGHGQASAVFTDPSPQQLTQMSPMWPVQGASPVYADSSAGRSYFHATPGFGDTPRGAYGATSDMSATPRVPALGGARPTSPADLPGPPPPPQLPGPRLSRVQAGRAGAAASPTHPAGLARDAHEWRSTDRSSPRPTPLQSSAADGVRGRVASEPAATLPTLLNLREPLVGLSEGVLRARRAALAQELERVDAQLGHIGVPPVAPTEAPGPERSAEPALPPGPVRAAKPVLVEELRALALSLRPAAAVGSAPSTAAARTRPSALDAAIAAVHIPGPSRVTPAAPSPRAAPAVSDIKAAIQAHPQAHHAGLEDHNRASPPATSFPSSRASPGGASPRGASPRADDGSLAGMMATLRQMKSAREGRA